MPQAEPLSSNKHSVLVIGQNSAWQNTYRVQSFQPGKVHRVRTVLRSAAGKGANLARGMGILRKSAHLLAYAGGANGDSFRRGCTEDGIAHTAVSIEAETRMCTTILGEDGSATEFAEPPPAVTSREREVFSREFYSLLPRADMLAIAGTAAEGEPEDRYLELSLEAAKLGIPVFIDSYRSHGRAALGAKPDILKINSDELTDLTGMPAGSHGDRKSACRKIREDFGIKWVIITTGKSGAEGFSDDGDVVASAPSIKAVNPIGSGDVFSSGIIAAFMDGDRRWEPRRLAEALRLATAMGTANCLSLKTGHVEAADLRSILPQISVEQLQ